MKTAAKKLEEQAKIASDPFAVLDEAVKERLKRRYFEVPQISSQDLASIEPSDDLTSLEVLRGLARKLDARIAVGITAKMEKIENENAHAHEERVIISASMVDAKRGEIIARSSINFPNPKTRKDAYYADFKRYLIDESRDLMQDLFVSGGKRSQRAQTKEEFTIIRVQYPSSPILTSKFRVLLEGIKGTKSVVEYKIRRGFFDFAVSPKMDSALSAKNIQNITSEDLMIDVLFPFKKERIEVDNEGADIVVKLSPKEKAVEPLPDEGGVSNEKNH
jgi:hypothetical protein